MGEMLDDNSSGWVPFSNDICRKMSISSAEAAAGTAGVNSTGIRAENSFSPQCRVQLQSLKG
jgi:hypothetical protein